MAFYRCGGDSKTYILKAGIVQSGYTVNIPATAQYNAVGGYIQNNTDASTAGNPVFFTCNLDVTNMKLICAKFSSGIFGSGMMRCGGKVTGASCLDVSTLTGNQTLTITCMGYDLGRMYDIWFEE